MSSDERDYTRSTMLRSWWLWENAKNFVDRWDEGAFDKAKYHGRTGSYFTGEALFPPAYWTAPPILPHINPLQPAHANNVVNMDNTRDGTTAEELYWAPRTCFTPPIIFNFDAFFPAFNAANYPLGAYVTVGLECNSGGYIGDIYEVAVINDGLGLRRVLRSNNLRDGVTTDEVLAIGVPDMGVWCSYKLVLTKHYLRLYYGTLPIVFPLTLIAELRLAGDILSDVIPYFANESAILVRNFRVGQFQVMSGTKFKEVTRVINQASIAAGNFRETTCLTFPKNAAISISQVYGVAATAGVMVYILGSQDYTCSVIDSENVTDPFAQFAPTFLAGATRARTVQYTNLPKYGRIRVRNLDGANAQGAVQVWIHEIP